LEAAAQKKMRGTSGIGEKSAEKHQSIIGGIEREKSLAIEFGRIFKAPNFSSFST
jgi:hypothetical protein